MHFQTSRRGGDIIMDKRMTTKEKILYILKKDGEVSMKELADYFTISDIAIRKHVQALLWDGFIKKRQERQEVGRPYHLYSLTEKGHHTFPNQYAELPVKLLEDLEALEGTEVVENLLRYRKQQEEQEFAKQLPDEDFDERMKKMIELQEEKGYMIDYSKLPNGDYEMKIFNCPIYNLASEFHQVCTNEKTMYQNLFPNSEVTITSHLTKGAKYCSWVISKESTERKVIEKTGT